MMPSRALFVIRIALFSGVTAFAALVIYQRSRNAIVLGPDGGSLMETMRYVLWALSGAAVAGALFLRPRIESAAPVQRGRMTLIGWALGEGVALFGVAQHYAGAPVTTLALGVLTFVVVLILLPVPQEHN